jgi:hypothetical protein
MDHLRKALDNMMGKDRDVPLKERMKNQKHFDSNEVCKYYLLDFCPHDLFPNTKSDLGPCKKRHDQQFQILFSRDPNKDQYLQKYEEMLMDFLEELIAEVDNKMKKCVERIEAPLPETERSKEVMDQVRLIDMKIGELIDQAEKFGEVGRIDDTEIIMRNIEKLKEQKNDMLTISEHPLMMKEKQMKVCEVCGAMQSMQDNEKRLQTHVEGKLHTGYARIREYLEMLRRRKLERKFKVEEEREKERIHREIKEKEKVRDREKDQRDYYRRRKSQSKSIERKLKDFERREIRRRDDREDEYPSRGGGYDKNRFGYDRGNNRTDKYEKHDKYEHQNFNRENRDNRVNRETHSHRDRDNDWNNNNNNRERNWNKDRDHKDRDHNNKSKHDKRGKRSRSRSRDRNNDKYDKRRRKSSS